MHVIPQNSLSSPFFGGKGMSTISFVEVVSPLIFEDVPQSTQSVLKFLVEGAGGSTLFMCYREAFDEV